MSLTLAPTYEILKSLTEGNKRFRDFISLGIHKATVAKLLSELDNKGFIERVVISTKPFKTEYSITPLGKKLLDNTLTEIGNRI
jgi:DNA-binding HxlR family transcriptional regulator